MLKKFIIFIVVVGLGYFAYQYFTQPEEPKDESFILLENLQQSTAIGFSEIGDVEFKWVVKVDPVIAEETVAGKGFEANMISNEQYDSIELFLKDNGFEVDLYNIAAGTISELTGYKKDKAVCAVSGGLTGYKEAEGQWVPPEPDKYDVTVNCGQVEKTEVEYATEDWSVYINEKYGYSLKYPHPCLYGPLPGYCKQSPPEERPQECRCYFNAEDPNEVSLGTYTGTKSDLTGAFFNVFHSIYVDYYSPPAGTDLVSWIKEYYSYYEDIPDEINTEIDGIPAVKVYTPFSGMAWSQEDIYFIKNDKVFQISMLNVDDEGNRELYDKILYTFSFEGETEQACLDSGGEVKISLCCLSSGDFPNLCLVGPCGCSPENSHEVMICDCGEGKCFDGEECVESPY